MKPVTQTLFGDMKGNCFAACIASLLELELATVPNFCVDHHSRWWDVLNDWLEPRGFVAIMLEGAEMQHYRSAYVIASGPSPREGVSHSVLYRNGELVHDPHPSRAGLLEVRDVIVLVAIDPMGSTRGYLCACYPDK